jgi:hypothetical protein
MNRAAVYGIAFVVFLIGLGVGAALRKPAVDVAVTVLNPTTGVRINVNGEFAGTTDTSGRLQFAFRARAGEHLQFDYQADHYEAVSRKVVVGQGGVTVPPVAMVPSLVDVSVTVRSVDAVGASMAGVGVSINGEARGYTSAEGVWESVLAIPYGSKVRVAVDGVPHKQVFDAVAGPVMLTFERPAGVPIQITAKNGVANVEIVHAGSVLAQTDREGRASFTIPVNSRGVILSFRLAGAAIPHWRIPDNKLATAGREVEYALKVRPASDLRLKLRAVMQDAPSEPAAGYEVQINGSAAGVTGPDGLAQVTIPKQRVLVGDRIAVRVKKGSKGVGSRRISVKAGQTVYPTDIQVSVPKIVRLALKDESGRPLPKVQVKVDGIPFSTSDSRGVAEGSVAKLNVEYRFTFHKDGFTAPVLPVRPRLPLTEKQVELTSLSCRVVFVDSLTGSPVEDLEVWYGDSRLFTTIGQEEVVNIPRLGRHKLRLASQDPRYPTSQQKTIDVSVAGAQIRVEVAPRPITFDLVFQRGNGGPIPNRQVDITGTGYRDQARTDDKGSVSFRSYEIRTGEKYQVRLTVGTGKYEWLISTSGYELSRVFKVESKGTLVVRATGGDRVELQLYPDRTSLALKTGQIASSQGTLRIKDLSFRDYELLAVAPGEAGQAPITIQQTITVDRPDVSITVDTDDPYQKGMSQLAAGDTAAAVEKFQRVSSLHRRFADAQMELCFYHSQRGRFVEAAGFCNAAVQDPNHQVNPYLYLACAQANHRNTDFGRGVACAQKAFTHYRRAASAPERRVLREKAQYLEALCLHDKHFDVNGLERTCDQTRADIDKVLYKWQTFLSDAQNDRDAAQRIAQCEGEILGLPSCN